MPNASAAISASMSVPSPIASPWSRSIPAGHRSTGPLIRATPIALPPDEAGQGISSPRGERIKGLCDPGTLVTELSWDMGDRYIGISLEGMMPWRVTSVVDEKMAFIVDWRRGEATIAELCRRHGGSRKTGHRLLNRFAAEGAGGLMERSRAPHCHPNAVPEAVSGALLAVL